MKPFLRKITTLNNLCENHPINMKFTQDVSVHSRGVHQKSDLYLE